MKLEGINYSKVAEKSGSQVRESQYSQSLLSVTGKVMVYLLGFLIAVIASLIFT
ncbi:hypothetical protein GBAG_3108 [Buttiauxella agrestis ATCC 33320]|uniref:Uncharacterized protein n=1 Tax=Buttiauxella agrestis ATCC 33320 TaxID=1006004 RepID=A0A085G5R6_9ENTR|nr:hypothetical protein GBAG_3108 [Buttiauxella agrestis ATCC 33320]